MISDMVKTRVFLEGTSHIFDYHGEHIPRVGDTIQMSDPGEIYRRIRDMRSYRVTDIIYSVDHAGVLMEIQISVLPIYKLDELDEHKKLYFNEDADSARAP